MIRRLILYGCLVILIAQAALQVHLAAVDTQTTDEAVHLSAGYTYLVERDYRFNPEHPPLIKTLAALPLLFLDVKQPDSFTAHWEAAANYHYDSWRENRRYGEELLYQAGNNPDQLLFWGRLPMVALTLLLGLVIFLIAWRHWGEYAALAAVGLYATNPLVTGHGHLITTDIAMSLGFLLTAYSAWRFVSKPVSRNAVYLGLSLGLALTVKHTAILLIPIMLVAWGLVAWRRRGQGGAAVGWRAIAVTVLTAWLVIWASFGLTDRSVPSTSTLSQDIITAYAERGQTAEGVSANAAVDQIYQTIRPLLLLLPGDYIKGALFVFIHSSNGHESFLLGHVSRTGWWYYFPILAVLKTPLAGLIAFGFGLAVLWQKRRSETLPVTLLGFAGLFLLLAMLSKANLGVRHVLPVFIILILITGWAAAASERLRFPMAMLLIWSAVGLGLSYPNYIGYFGELAGSSRNGYKIATDSNLDWGQDARRIAAYIDDQASQSPVVEYSWLGDSGLKHYLGSNFRLPSTGELVTGERIIIGATAYQRPAYAFLRQRGECVQFLPTVFDCVVTK